MFNKIIVVFPGQGSNLLVWERSIENYPVAREVFKELTIH